MAEDYVIMHFRRGFVYGTREEIASIAADGAEVHNAEVEGNLSKRGTPMIFWSHDVQPHFNIIFGSKSTAKEWLKEEHPELKLGKNIFWTKIYNMEEYQRIMAIQI
jgi:hypothetical protein